MAKEKIIYASAPGIVDKRRNKKPDVQPEPEYPQTWTTPAPESEQKKDLPYALKEMPKVVKAEPKKEEPKSEVKPDEHDPA